MTIGWFRDLVIIIFGLVGAGFLVIIAVMALSFSQRLKVILNSLRITSANMEEISSVAKEQVVRPIIRMGSVFQSVTKWIEVIGEFLNKNKKGVNDGE
jgi:hypothetical protein